MRDTSAIQALIDRILRTDAVSRHFTDLRDIARSAECELLRLASPAPVRAVRLTTQAFNVPIFVRADRPEVGAPLHSGSQIGMSGQSKEAGLLTVEESPAEVMRLLGWVVENSEQQNPA